MHSCLLGKALATNVVHVVTLLPSQHVWQHINDMRCSALLYNIHLVADISCLWVARVNAQSTPTNPGYVMRFHYPPVDIEALPQCGYYFEEKVAPEEQVK